MYSFEEEEEKTREKMNFHRNDDWSCRYRVFLQRSEITDDDQVNTSMRCENIEKEEKISTNDMLITEAFQKRNIKPNLEIYLL